MMIHHLLILLALVQSCHTFSHHRTTIRFRTPSTASYAMSTVIDEVKSFIDIKNMQFSETQGKILLPQVYPSSLSEVKAILPEGTFQKSTLTSLRFAAIDVLATSLSAFLGVKYLLPFAHTLLISSNIINQLSGIALWALYSAITGTCAIGMWVTAHECGHGAFSDNRNLQDIVGYIFHSLMLVPYFSWQRTHAVHHANTNHVTDGETHVPPIRINPSTHISSKVKIQKVFGSCIGECLFGWSQILIHLLIGWPAYLLLGATGGSSRGVTNHFIPLQFPLPGQKRSELKELFPTQGLKNKVWLSDVGVVAVLYGLYTLAQQVGWQWIAAAYGGPYLVINAWLVGYTWLQHTEVDMPHLPADNFNFLKGAFHTIDRPYGNLLFGVIDFLHHHIGSTHVVHHIDCTIPHYKAQAATIAVKQAYPNLYMYESTPIFQALWRVATKCFLVEKRVNKNNQDVYVFVDPK